MFTYQDLLNIKDDEKDRMAFILDVIAWHKTTDLYKNAVIAYDYFDFQNTTIMQYEKTLTTVTGQIVPDKWSPNHKMVSGYFNFFVTQQNQYLLGNGVTWAKNSNTGKVLDDDFDNKLQEVGQDALIGGIAFGFRNKDSKGNGKLDIFNVTEFAPLYDEETGALRSGVRWWQIDSTKPLRATLYEEDGYTEYIWRISDNGKQSGEVLQPKRAYVINTVTTGVDGTQIVDGENYNSFPIVPLRANRRNKKQGQSELVGIREGIDAYDLIANGYENDLDNAQLYWIIKGAGGMDDPDLARFLQRLKYNKIAAVGDGQEVDARTIELPYEARVKLLNIIETMLYKNYQALNLDDIKSGSVVNAQIKAAYAPMDLKANAYEYCVLKFINSLLAIAGVEDQATFTRDRIVNTQEEVQTVIMAGDSLTSEYKTRKILTLLGDGDKADEILDQLAADELDRGAVTEEYVEVDEDGTPIDRTVEDVVE